MTNVVKLPASVRHRNPGAMGLGSKANSSAKIFGASKNTRLGDGNVIATFPTSVDGASALFHLLYTVYSGMTLWAVLHKWGDGATLEKNGERILAKKRTDGYVASMERLSPFQSEDVISKEMLLDADSAIAFGKAMARHEAGLEYPMTDAQWREAHEQFVEVIHGGKPALDKANPLPVTAPLELAKTFIGERRVPGAGTNEKIEDLFVEIGSKIRGDDESFCAAGVGAMLKRTGYAYVAAPAGQTAKSYLNYGHAIDEPEEGCIVVQWRESPNSWKGHVEFVESWTATHLTVVGFNRGGAVVRTTIPRLKSNGGRVLGYRRPVAAVRPKMDVAKDEEVQRTTVGLLGTLSLLFWTIWDGVVGLARAAGDMVGLLPDTAAHVGQTVGAGQQLTEAAGIPWPVQLGLFIAVTSILFQLYRMWNKRRVHDGRLTKPPYETDELIDGDGAEDAPVGPDPDNTPSGGASLVVRTTLEGSRYSRADVVDLLQSLNDQVGKGIQIVVDGNSEGTAQSRKSRGKPKAKRASPAKPKRRRAA